MTEELAAACAHREELRRAARVRHRAWLQLVRAPNLLTAPGDPIAGACLAGVLGSAGSLRHVLIAAVASVAVYAGALVDNDLVDLAEDRAERPDRPLPSGAVALGQARKGRVLLLAFPFLLAGIYTMPAAWLLVHVGLLVASLGYNRLKRRSVWLGAGLMGLCRALSLASGVVLVGVSGGTATGVGLWPLAVLLSWFAYVAGICLFAAHETTRVPGGVRYLLLLPPLGLLAGTQLAGVPALAAWGMHAAGVCGMVLGVDVLVRLHGSQSPADVPPAVGRLVRNLIPMQALLCLAAVGFGPGFAAVLMLGWLGCERLGRRFYAS